MARTDPQLNFRIPAELKERLEAAAVGNKRTLTAELVARLEHTLSSESGSVSEYEAADAQLKITQTGLRLAEMASQFLKLEVPAVAGSDSYRMLLETLHAGLLMAPESHPNESPEPLTSASEALDSLRSIAEKMGILKTAEASESTQTTKSKKRKS